MALSSDHQINSLTERDIAIQAERQRMKEEQDAERTADFIASLKREIKALEGDYYSKYTRARLELILEDVENGQPLSQSDLEWYNNK